MSRRDLLLVAVVIASLSLLAKTLFETATRPQFDTARSAGRRDASEKATIEQVDREFRAHWKKQKLQHADPADSMVVARRISLALTGTVPSLEEVRQLESLEESERLDWWLEHLLDDRRSSDYLAERFARAFVGVEEGPFLLFRRRRFVMWLADQLADEVPYNQLVRGLLTGTGLWTDKPSVNFFTIAFDNNQDKLDAKRLAGRVSRAFLGMRIDCLQCHNDQLGNVALGTAAKPRMGTQQDFHQLAAFFGKTETSVFGVREVNDKREYSYKYLDAEKDKVVQPSVPFATELLPTEGSRREQLAAWVTHADNRPFARAAVNRTWGILFGRSLVDPIDDIPLYEDPANDRYFPPALETLADDFIKHNFDLRRLIRLIARTEVFQLESRAEFEVHMQHEDEWAVFPLVRLRPEQVAGSIIQSCSLQTIDAKSNVFSQLARYFQQDDFIRRYGDMGQDEFQERGGTVTQRLLMMNGRLVKARTNRDLVNNAATQIVAVTISDAKAVEAAYLSVLGRRPSPREAAHFQGRLAGIKGDARIPLLEDLYWALLNSTEFSWNH